MLRKLSNEVLGEVTEEYMQGDDPEEKIKREKWREEHSEEIENRIDLGKFNKAVDETIDEFDPGDSSADKFIAPKIHQALKLDRRDALDSRLWNYLTLVERPDYVRHRFTSCAENRFITKNNLNRNVFSRLWWMSEISSRGGDYDLTQKLFEDQNLAQYLTDSRFSRIEPVVRPFIKVCSDLDNTDDVVDVGKNLSAALSTLAIETMSEEEIEEMMYSIKEHITEENGSESFRDRLPF